jgi:integrase
MLVEPALSPDDLRLICRERGVHFMVKRAAAKAGINEDVSPHWLRHAHAIDGGASVPEVKETLGHGNIATTSGYLHARPGSSSGLRLDEGVFLRGPHYERIGGMDRRRHLVTESYVLRPARLLPEIDKQGR